jgi:hypothetical protein
MTTLDQIESLAIQCTDPNMDGFYQWNKKRQLYEILWAVEKALEKCPTFSVEKEWIEESKVK